jgi:hypothetical protein
MSEDWPPCRYIDYGAEMGDPRYGVMPDHFDATQDMLESTGCTGGGYTWHGIVESTIRRQHANYAEDLQYDPESSMFCGRSSNLDALRCVADCIRTTLTDSQVVDEAYSYSAPAVIVPLVDECSSSTSTI